MFKEEKDWKSLLSRVNTCVISDIMDGIGASSGVISHKIIPLNEAKTFLGEAITVQWEYVRKNKNITEPRESTWEQVRGFLLDGKIDTQDKIYVSGFGKLLPEMALAGGLSLKYFENIGIKAMVLGGGMRDAEVVKESNIPVFGQCFTPADTQGIAKIAKSKGSCIIDNIEIRNNDIIKGDESGIIVIPRDRLDEILDMIPQVEAKEKKIMELISQGKNLVQVIEKFKWI